jgi:cytochrome c oxidase assembly factor CtaG
MAPTTRAEVAAEERPVLGELAMQVLYGCIGDRTATVRVVGGSKSDHPVVGRGHDTRSVPASFGPARSAEVRATMTAMTRRSSPRVALPVGLGAAVLAWLAAVPVASAHGPAPAEPPTLAGLLFGWTFEPLPTLGITVALGLWWWAVRRVDRAHPANRVPRRRSVAFGLGMLALAFALLSGIERYDTTLFSVHMVQHILLVLVAAPLIAFAAPITLLLRVATPGLRRGWILPVLHSRIVRILAFPVVAWLVFAGVMWASHFSPLFDAALEDPRIHDLEHLLFLSTALLFWWPAIAQDPGPWRMPHPGRALYVFLQMPQNTFLAVVILGASTVLYPHYATTGRTWGPTPLEDQRLAAGIMWLAGDAIFLAAVLGIVWAWMRHEARDAPRADRRAAAELEAIRAREVALAERRARERDEAQSGSGVPR